MYRLPTGFVQADGYGEGVLAADPYLYFASLAGGLLDDPSRQASC